MNHQKHVPVLLAEVVELLNPVQGDSYLDMTAGYGGHARAIKDRTGNSGSMTLIDRDIEAIASLGQTFAGEPGVRLLHSDFLAASLKLAEAGRRFDVILADLGVSSQHFNNPARGFSHKNSGPLDMRMDTSQTLSAAHLVNEATEADLAGILKKYGELPNARLTARHIIAGRPYATTLQLSNRITQLGKNKKRINPSTLVFQALRIAVNDELQMLEKALPIWHGLLKSKGRIGVISFHSLEDRIVKKFFTDNGGNRYDATLRLLSKKPVVASADEIVFNPRARSAKFRSAQRK